MLTVAEQIKLIIDKHFVVSFHYDTFKQNTAVIISNPLTLKTVSTVFTDDVIIYLDACLEKIK